MGSDEKEYLELEAYQETSFERTLKRTNLPLKEPMLPLIHKADSVKDPERNRLTAMDYLISGVIPVVPCKVFGEDLAYTYIGRPAYRELTEPVCFILKPEPELLQNIFLFDTGAYYGDRYRRIIDEGLDIDLFRIPADRESVIGFIECYYGTNENYLLSHSVNVNEFSERESEEEFAYLLLEHIRSFNDLDFDERCRTLENILRTPISLQTYLQGVILPRSLRENEKVAPFCDKNSGIIDIMTYDDIAEYTTPVDRNNAVDEILFRYYQEKGYISHEV